MENKILIVSIKPEFADKIFSGDKTIELRKAMPNVKKGDKIIIYVTNPVKAIRGIGTIDNIVEGTPNVIWKKYNSKTGISKKTFFDYYSNSLRAVGIVISDIFEFKEEVKLEDIKRQVPSFAPPQTFKYSTAGELALKYKLMQFQVA
jgi:predicted transcriptional regulator